MKHMFKLARVLVCTGLLVATAVAQDEFPYRDERTDAVSLVRSYYNAINRHEYARAWSYWHTGVEGQTYEEFIAGFADTEFVEIVTGKPETEGAAGSVYYAVPVALEASENQGEATTYAGCFFLKLVQPAIQEPPFEPLHIMGAALHEVTGHYTEALPEVCAP